MLCFTCPCCFQVLLDAKLSQELTLNRVHSISTVAISGNSGSTDDIKSKSI